MQKFEIPIYEINLYVGNFNDIKKLRDVFGEGYLMELVCGYWKKDVKLVRA